MIKEAIGYQKQALFCFFLFVFIPDFYSGTGFQIYFGYRKNLPAYGQNDLFYG